MKTLALAAAIAFTGCYKTRFDLMPPTGEAPSPHYDNHFHINLINIIEISSPVDLVKACNNMPPAAIEEEVGFVGGIVNILFAYAIPILSVHNATVMCPFGGPPMQPHMAPQPMPQPYPPQPYPQPMPPPPPPQ